MCLLVTRKLGNLLSFPFILCLHSCVLEFVTKIKQIVCKSAHRKYFSIVTCPNGVLKHRIALGEKK